MKNKPTEMTIKPMMLTMTVISILGGTSILTPMTAKSTNGERATANKVKRVLQALPSRSQTSSKDNLTTARNHSVGHTKVRRQKTQRRLNEKRSLKFSQAK
jgi:hypothetical protein